MARDEPALDNKTVLLIFLIITIIVFNSNLNSKKARQIANKG